MSCRICKLPTVEHLEFEAGNNAEVPVSFPVCEKHLEEFDKDEWIFRDKYGDKIEDMAGQHWIDLADHLRDEAKYK
jgi:hypothetical protein